jgi:translation initiation factor 5B
MSLIPTCSVIGHVDVGKTSFLNYFKQKKTNEVRGITQQLTVYSYDKLHLSECVDNTFFNDNFKLNGLIFIDTPGHEYFSQMRTVTSSISHLVIVMIDIIKGIEPTHIEILKYLRESHIDFIIVLNKMDKIFDWICKEKQSLKNTFKTQKKEVIVKLNNYANNIICQLAEHEINACLYYNNTDYKTFISMVPLSSKSGEGISDLLIVISKLIEKKAKLFEKAEFYKEIKGFVVDSRVDDKFGKLFTVITYSEIKEYDSIQLINKLNQIKTLKLKHIIQNNVRVNSTTAENVCYLTLEDKSIELESGDIIINKDYVKKYSELILSQISLNFDNDDINDINVIEDKGFDTNDEKLKLDKYGICIISLSKMMHGALYKMFHSDLNTPISICAVDKLNKNIIIKTINNNTVNKNDKLLDKKYEYYRVILIFEPVLKEHYIEPVLLEFATRNKITIIESNSIYRLKEKYEKYCENISNGIKSEYSGLMNCEIEIVPDCIFMKTSPLLIGFKIKKGILNIGTKIQATSPKGNVTILGTIKSIEKDKKALSSAEINEEVCVKIETIGKKIIYKTDFDETYKFETYRTKDDEMVMKMFQSELS